MLAEALTGSRADFDNIDRLVPQMGLQFRAQAVLPGGGRLIKTHEKYRREYRKAICLVRDIRSVMVSLYSRGSRVGVFNHLSFPEFVPMFLAGRSTNVGSWQAHIRSWLECPLSEDGRLLVVRYEDMRVRPEPTLNTILRFLGFSIDSNEWIGAILNNSMESMRTKENQSKSFPRAQEEEGRFVRQGAIAGWDGQFSPQELTLVNTYAGKELQLLGYPLEYLNSELTSSSQLLRN
jgi:hypothetical protein